MRARLVAPQEAARQLAARLDRKWADAVCTELEGRADDIVSIPLSPGVVTREHVRILGFDARLAWIESWGHVTELPIPGVHVERKHVADAGTIPSALVVAGLEAALAFLPQTGVTPATDFKRARRIAHDARSSGAVLSPAALRGAYGLGDEDVEVALRAVRWLADHPDVSAWTSRQLPIPGMHSKWLDKHGSVLARLVGRDVRTEVHTRPAVAHLTYVDPTYRATGARRHDAWTAGDTHDLAYRPSTVLIVENRDCRIRFPATAEGTVVVEGGGKAAAGLIATISWVRQADTIVYWGDLDADGFAILDRLRQAMSEPTPDAPARWVESILMDAVALDRYADLGVDRDREGRAIRASSAYLQFLTEQETAAYYQIATAGYVPVRRLEQERIPFEEAARLLAAVSRRRENGQHNRARASKPVG